MKHVGRILFVMAYVLAVHGAAAGAPGLDREDSLHVATQDVFVIDGSSLRNPTSETADDEPLFNNAGVALGLTWGEWRAVSATSVMAEIGGPARPRTDVRLHAEGLVANGVYSVFYITLSPDSRHPECANIDRSVPLVSLHGDRQRPDASSFVADAAGVGSFHGRVDGVLLSADEVFLDLIYHHDGETYHPFANAGQAMSGCTRSSYGEDAMRHLIVQQKGSA